MVKAINIAGETSSHAFLLVQDIFCFSAKQVLSFTQEVEDVYAKEKDTMVTFECETNEPFVKVKWLKNNAEIFSGDKYRMHSDRKVITAPTPVLDISEHVVDTVEPSEKIAGAPSDENTSQTLKHKFTFSFDDIGEVPKVFRELENISCSDGQTVILECIILGEPAPSVIWLHDDIALDPLNIDKYKFEEHDKSYRLYIYNFTYLDAGTYRCTATNKHGQVESVADVSFDSTALDSGFSSLATLEMGELARPLGFSTDITPTVRAKTFSGPSSVLTKNIRIAPDVTERVFEENVVQSIEGKSVRNRSFADPAASELHHFIPLAKVTEVQHGEYTCRASNQHGSDSYRTLHFSECCGTNIYLLLQSNSFLFLFLLL
uniref:Ig-like domain-containing protein n=1 Tax=Pygocentrus nattereri TaxID=42514 RepID=A0AAR2JF13_PYGNA